jgi:hypothetical protein
MAGNVQVTSRVELNMSVLNMLDGAQYEALAQTGDATLTELRDRQVMPFDTGNLQDDSTFVDDSEKGRVSIVSSTPYARRLYFHPEYNFRRGNNARAGGKWFDSFLNDNFISNAYAKLLKRIGRL